MAWILRWVWISGAMRRLGSMPARRLWGRARCAIGSASGAYKEGGLLKKGAGMAAGHPEGRYFLQEKNFRADGVRHSGYVGFFPL